MMGSQIQQTTLQTITYKANDDLDFVKEIKKNYNIKSKGYVSITIANRGYGEFSVDISIEAENGQYISVLNHIVLKKQRNSRKILEDKTFVKFLHFSI